MGNCSSEQSVSIVKTTGRRRLSNEKKKEDEEEKNRKKLKEEEEEALKRAVEEEEAAEALKRAAEEEEAAEALKRAAEEEEQKKVLEEEELRLKALKEKEEEVARQMEERRRLIEEEEEAKKKAEIEEKQREQDRANAMDEAQRKAEEEFNSKLVYPDEVELSEWIGLVDVLCNQHDLNAMILGRKRADLSSLGDLVQHFTSLNLLEEVDKTWAAFYWISHNIELEETGALAPNEVFKAGKCSSDGYASLFKYLCESFGVKCESMDGYFKGKSYFNDLLNGKSLKLNHYWNKVNIENKWYFVNATLAAAYVVADSKEKQKKFQPYYFLVPPSVFVYLCCNLQNQHLAPRFISKSDFEKLPQYRLEYFICGFKCRTHLSVIILPDLNPFSIEFTAPLGYGMKGELRNAKSDEKLPDSVLVQRDPNRNRLVVEVNAPPGQKYKLHLTGGRLGQKFKFAWIGDFLIDSPSTLPQAQPFCKNYLDHNVFLYEPKQKYLKQGAEYTFKVYSKDLEVILQEREQEQDAAQCETINFVRDESSSDTWSLEKYIPKNINAKLYIAVGSTGQTYSSVFTYDIISS